MILSRAGEDIDFVAGGAIISNASGARFRSGYARCGICTSWPAVDAKGKAFTPITSGWLHGIICPVGASNEVSIRLLGLVDSATANKGLWVGTNGSDATKLSLFKYDGTTLTTLGTDPTSGRLAMGAAGLQVDVQLVNYGATATVNVFVGGVQVIAYSGDVTVSGVTALDCIGVNGTANYYWMSEMIVADEDTRTFSLATLAPDSDGTTTDWPTGAYSDVDEITINDADVNTTDTAGQDQQFNVNDLPTGYFAIKDVCVKARASRTADATATKLALGINSGGTVNVGTAADPGTSWVTQERALGATNPVTTDPWTLSEINALQLDLQSGS